MRTRRSLGAFLALSLLGTVALVGVNAAGAAPGWVVSNPAPTGGVRPSLAGVACPIPTTCFAVGQFVGSGSTNHALIEQWNGAKWVLSAGSAAAPLSSELKGVSCASPTSCFAVGFTNRAGVNQTLIERWDGVRWSIVASPNPVGGALFLNAVSCASPTFCVAAGNYNGPFGQHTLMEHWDGGRWSIVASPGLAGPELLAVSCASASACFAVGNNYDDIPHTLTERWNGTEWSVVPSPDLAGAVSNQLWGVSCASTTSCFAVGAAFPASGVRTLAERWNGSAWTILPMANQSTANQLKGVTCESSTACIAVGLSTRAAKTSTLVERWNGTNWRVVASPDSDGATGNTLFGVSCFNSTGCFAVGTSQRPVVVQSMLIERYMLHAGYWMVDGGGTLYGFGDANVMTPRFPGNPVAIASTGASPILGYWIVDAKGNVQGGLHGRWLAPPPSFGPAERVTSISGTPSANGYWLFTNLGRVFAYGDAHSYGDLAHTPLNGPIVASVATPSGHGYYMVGSDGGVFAFGDAKFRGSTGAMKLQQPVNAIATSPDNHGYWLAASDGGVFSFGVTFHGSMGHTRLNRPVVGITSYGNGYLMVGSDGGTFDFSDQPFAGSLGGNPPATPVVGIAGLLD